MSKPSNSKSNRVSDPQTSQCASPLFELLSAEDFIDRPEPDWLIDEILPNTGFASVYGPSGVGKSFVCIDMAAAIASGSEWFGFPTKESRVVYVALEGQAGFPRRVRAWSSHNEKPFPAGVQFVFNAFALTQPAHTRELGDLIVQYGGAGLIIIDTLNRAAPGADENASADMGKIIAGATALQQATGAMVLLIHHAGKDVSKRLRGHSSLIAALDTAILVDRHGDLIRWTLDKSKDSEDQLSRLCNLSIVEVGQNKSGKALTSCVVTPVEGSVALQQIRLPEGKNQRQILTVVREALVEQRLQSALTDPDWPNGFPEGLPYDHILELIKGTLTGVSTKHRQQRTKEALVSLIDGGFLSLKGGLLCLPSKVTPTNVEGKNVS
jgi:putative DNA primase/helicase